MMIHIANPIYDSVFKYLMEDERIAKTLLSALLKKEVVAVEIRRNEYTNGVRDNISMFRIDFGAHVKEADGTVHLVLIELQKTWLETETLRFRQYLSAQYANPENVPTENNKEGYAIPMVAIYLLGHKVGDIKVPVLYVDHKAYDYDGNLVTEGIPNPFVESLTHDSIIVQIPRLHGQVNNRLEKILSVFDQTLKNGSDRHVLNINDTPFDDDDDMQYLLRRLLMAAADSQLRQEMNVEDEYFKALEDRDTALMIRDKKLAEQEEMLKQNEAQLKQNEVQLKQNEAQLKQNEAQLKQNEAQMKTMVHLLSNTGMGIQQIAEAVGMPQDQVRLLLDE